MLLNTVSTAPLCSTASSAVSPPQDFDLEALYIDGFLKIVKCDLSEMEGFFKQLEAFAIKFNVNITISINGKAGTSPAYLDQYLA